MPFTDYTSETNNIQIDNAKDIDVVIPMYNLIEYCNNYLKKSRSFWQNCRDKPSDNMENSESFQFKVKTTGKTADADNDNIENVEMLVPLKHLSNFWRALEMFLINSEINLILTWSENYVISSATGEANFNVTDTKLYVPVVTVSTQDNAKLL